VRPKLPKSASGLSGVALNAVDLAGFAHRRKTDKSARISTATPLNAFSLCVDRIDPSATVRAV
jgi:hypothetical protein